MLKTNFKTKAQIIISMVGMGLLISSIAHGQDLSEVENAVSRSAQSGKNIIKIIVDVVFLIGGLGLAYAFVNKDERAKQYLISYFIGVTVWVIIRQLFMD